MAASLDINSLLKGFVPKHLGSGSAEEPEITNISLLDVLLVRSLLPGGCQLGYKLSARGVHPQTSWVRFCDILDQVLQKNLR